ncbi:MAG: hypothetical protein KKE62_15235, partial [Proteobacteria bacterium]|nr:hypothetical protein [Pseudomonadota bacterium]MBU1544185.1 hypothetical protein [Pseudomonadota bacterium]
ADQGYDKITGGEGYDTILGGTGDDTISLNNFRDDQTVEEIDGGDGINVIAGGPSNYDYLDFSNTKLTNIDRIDAGSHNDTVIGSDEADVIVGGTGNDTLNGGAGNDTYIFNAGDGRDVIYDSGTSNAGDDTLQFGEEIRSNDIAFYQDDNNLVIGINGNDQIIVRDQIQADNAIENFQLGDGSFMTSTDINLLIQEMTAFSQDQGISFSSVDDVRNNQDLMNIVVHSWHQS